MTWSAFKTKVLTYLDVDATRRGIDALRTSYIKAAVIDLKHFVALFDDGTKSADYADSDVTPFVGHDEKAAEATAMYLKSRLARVVDKDLQMAASYWDDYKRVRRELIRESQEIQLSDGSVYTKNLSQKFGDTLPFNFDMIEDEAGGAWVSWTDYKLFFTIKRFKRDADDKALVNMTTASGEGITTPTSSRAYWEVDTADKLCLGTFWYEIQIQNVPANRIKTLQQGNIELTRDLIRGPNQ